MATFSDRSWSSINASDYADGAAYCSACLIDENPAGKTKIKDLCWLPVKEPGGAYNRNAIRAAWASINGARGGMKGPSQASRARARARLVRLADMAGIELAQ